MSSNDGERRNEGPQRKDEDTFKILVATDCHLGFLEKDPRRGNDSLVTFEEILSVAKNRNVDFILLAGDLFHLNKPSRKTMHSTMQLIRKYCFGDKPVPFQFLSDPAENFRHCSFPGVNFEDPNFNVGIPVFSIHGNHDDPIGDGNLCALDLLSVTGLINYFGKCTDFEKVQISPILLQKGQTRIALYGIGSMKDDRLHRLMRSEQVSLLGPKDSKEWFNIMAIHQNRVPHGGQTKYIPEEFLEDLLNFVIWGHEHDCRITPEYNSQRDFHVSQPGSSVATSLTHGEAIPKKIGLLSINKFDFQMKEISLKTVRQMYVEDIDLAKCGIDEDLQISERIMEYCKEIVDKLLQKAERDHSGHIKQPKMPLIRLRIEYTKEEQVFNIHQFGRCYSDKVANSKDMVKFHLRRNDKGYKFRQLDPDVKELLDDMCNEVIETTRVEDVVREVFENLDEKQQLLMLTEEGLADALQEFVDKHEDTSIRELVDYQIKKVQQHLRGQSSVNEDTIEDEVFDYKSTTLKLEKNCTLEAKKMFKNSGKKSKASDDFDDDEDEVTSLIPIDNSTESSARGKKRGRGSTRGSARGSTSGRGRSRAAAKSSASGSRSMNKTNIKDMFQKSKPKSSDSDEVSIIESDSDDDFSFSRSKNSSRNSKNSRFGAGSSRGAKRSLAPDNENMTSASQSSITKRAKKSTPGKGLVFFDDDEEED